LFRTVFPIPFSEIIKSELWEGELLQTKRDGTQITVASRWTTLRNNHGELTGWLEINTDISARKQAEDAARRLSGRILNLQDEERRRIARELHDSLGQYLTVAKINLDLLAAAVASKPEAKLVSECVETISRCLAETRTLSHLLHPPLLDEAGFVSAARWYAEGLAQRSGIEVNLDFPPSLARMDGDIETVLFRALQEALTNVHRHSGGSMVDVRLRLDAERVRMEIQDNGKGMPEQRAGRFTKGGVGSGVGLAGMRERVREVGGSLAILSGSSGTSVIITIPLAQFSDESESGQDGSSAPGSFSVA
jgi:signal transduction histidine kinase